MKETEGQTEPSCACRKASTVEGSLTCSKTGKTGTFVGSTIKTRGFFVLLEDQMSHSDETDTSVESVPVILRHERCTSVNVSVSS